MYHFLRNSQTFMKTISIASNEDSVFIRLDRTLLDDKKIIQFIKLVEDMFPDLTVFPVEGVSMQEQAEIENIIDSMSIDDKKIDISRFVTL